MISKEKAPNWVSEQSVGHHQRVVVTKQGGDEYPFPLALREN